MAQYIPYPPMPAPAAPIKFQQWAGVGSIYGDTGLVQPALPDRYTTDAEQVTKPTGRSFARVTLYLWQAQTMHNGNNNGPLPFRPSRREQFYGPADSLPELQRLALQRVVELNDYMEKAEVRLHNN